MNPSDWVADCMVPDAWLHEPFCLDGAAVACDGSALIAFPGKGKHYSPPRFDIGQDCSEQIKAALSQAQLAETSPAEDLKSLGLIEQHEARLSGVEGLHVLAETVRTIIHVMEPSTGELVAYGIIYKGAQAG